MDRGQRTHPQWTEDTSTCLLQVWHPPCSHASLNCPARNKNRTPAVRQHSFPGPPSEVQTHTRSSWCKHCVAMALQGRSGAARSRNALPTRAVIVTAWHLPQPVDEVDLQLTHFLRRSSMQHIHEHPLALGVISELWVGPAMHRVICNPDFENTDAKCCRPGRDAPQTPSQRRDTRTRELVCSGSGSTRTRGLDPGARPQDAILFRPSPGR